MPDRQALVVDHLELERGHHVAEIGFGHGVAASLVLDQLGSEGRYTGFDRSPAMAEAARKRNRSAVDTGRAVFATAALAEASVEPASQDRVFACRVRELADPVAMATARSWLRPKGSLVLAFDDPDPDRTDEVVERALSAAAEIGAPCRMICTPSPSGEVVCVVIEA